MYRRCGQLQLLGLRYRILRYHWPFLDSITAQTCQNGVMSHIPDILRVASKLGMPYVPDSQANRTHHSTMRPLDAGLVYSFNVVVVLALISSDLEDAAV